MKKILLYCFYSAVLLFLSFKVFAFWPLSFVALVPYFYILNSKKHVSLKEVFLSSFFFGSVFSLLLLGVVLLQHPLILFIAVFICGIFFGLLGVLYTKLKQNTIWDIFIFAALWVIIEWIRQIIFQDFDYTTIAYTSYALTPILSFASIGGRSLVSFIIVLINAFIGYFKINRNDKKIRKVFTCTLLIFVCIYFSNQYYLKLGNHDGHEVSFATIQVKESYDPYPDMRDGKLVFNPQVETLINKGVKRQVDYIIYPYNLVHFIITHKNSSFTGPYMSTTFEDVDVLLKKSIPENMTFVFWTDTMREEEGNHVYDETDFWKNGTLTGYYQKRNIHPFYDLTSHYFIKSGTITKPYTYTASTENKLVRIGNDRFSNLSCSELNYSLLGRRDTQLGANIILSVGYASVFEHPSLGNLDLVLMQFRAAETNLPAIRSDIRGPSAFINKEGEIVSRIEPDQNTISTEGLFIEDAPQKTLYVIFGDYLFMTPLFLILIFLGLYHYKNKKR